MKQHLTRILLLTLLFIGAEQPAFSNTSTPSILVMGDSLMAWHRTSGRSIGDVIERRLGASVRDRSVAGARMMYALPISGAMGMNIAKQYRPGRWDWVVVNGGGNDLWFGCGCNRCKKHLTRMISADGRSGAVPSMVYRIRKSGARVVFVGYLRSPGVGSPVEHCRDDGDAYEQRLAKMAKRMDGVYFLSVADLVPTGDRSFHGIDMIHPSPKGASAIGGRVAALIQRSTQ